MKVVSIVDRIVSKSQPIVDFDPIKFVDDVRILTRASFASGALGNLTEVERYEDKLMTLMEEGAYKGILYGWNYCEFLLIYPEFKYFFDTAEAEIAQRREYDNYANHHRNFNGFGHVTVYCPLGCNHVSVDAEFPWSECGACGRRMTPKNNTSEIVKVSLYAVV